MKIIIDGQLIADSTKNHIQVAFVTDTERQKIGSVISEMPAREGNRIFSIYPTGYDGAEKLIDDTLSKLYNGEL